MILADKIIELRKRSGMSQEELAEKLNVSRQAVSKWEGAQSTPDLNRILQLSELFGVSTDYLLKDEIDTSKLPETVVADEKGENSESLYRVSMEEANGFLEANRKRALFIASGVALCILSVTPPILFDGAGGDSSFFEGFGVTLLFIFIAAAVALFIAADSMMKPYRAIREEAIDTEYGVSGMVKVQHEKFYPTRTRSFIIGVVLCIMSVTPPIISDSFYSSSSWIAEELAPVLLFLLVAVGVFLIVWSSVINRGFSLMLAEKRYKRKKNEKTEAIKGIYWLVVLAIYLGYSFITMNWHISWIIWPIAAILDGILEIVLNNFTKK